MIEYALMRSVRMPNLAQVSLAQAQTMRAHCQGGLDTGLAETMRMRRSRCASARRQTCSSAFTGLIMRMQKCNLVHTLLTMSDLAKARADPAPSSA